MRGPQGGAGGAGGAGEAHTHPGSFTLVMRNREETSSCPVEKQVLCGGGQFAAARTVKLRRCAPPAGRAQSAGAGQEGAHTCGGGEGGRGAAGGGGGRRRRRRKYCTNSRSKVERLNLNPFSPSPPPPSSVVLLQETSWAPPSAAWTPWSRCLTAAASRT